MKEKEQEIQKLTSRLDQYEEAQKEGRIFSREYTKQLHELDKKLEETIAHLNLKKQQEKQQERVYETTSIDDIETKDQKFEQYNNTRRERMKQERNLIKSKYKRIILFKKILFILSYFNGSKDKDSQILLLKEIIKFLGTCT